MKGHSIGSEDLSCSELLLLYNNFIKEIFCICIVKLKMH